MMSGGLVSVLAVKEKESKHDWRNMDTKKCRKCKTELTDENWLISLQEISSNICRNCYLEYHKNYREERREEIKEREKKHYQKHRKELRERGNKIARETCLNTSNGKIYRNIKKRSYPSNPKHCELCGQYKKLLVYHHFENREFLPGDFILGIWVCQVCHNGIHLFHERGLGEKYEELKKELENERT